MKASAKRRLRSGSCQKPMHLILDQRAVRQPGQIVEIGALGELSLGFLALGEIDRCRKRQRAVEYARRPRRLEQGPFVLAMSDMIFRDVILGDVILGNSIAGRWRRVGLVERGRGQRFERRRKRRRQLECRGLERRRSVAVEFARRAIGEDRGAVLGLHPQPNRKLIDDADQEP